MRGRHPRRRRRPSPAGPPLALPGRLYGIRVWDLSIDSRGAVRLGAGEATWRSDGQGTWARCTAPAGAHPAGASTPAADCSCGLYALHPRRGRGIALLAWSQGFRAVGIVEAWGRVHVHAEGFRAQYARPVALLRARRARGSDFGRLIEDVVIAHRAALLELDHHGQLVEHCERHGLGMSRESVEALLAERAPRGVRVDRAPAEPPG